MFKWHEKLLILTGVILVLGVLILSVYAVYEYYFYQKYTLPHQVISSGN